MPVADAFAAIVAACIRHFRFNEAGVVDARRPEALHQARVAIRRLRSAFSLFRDLLGDAESEAMRERLRAFSGHLGDARNLDVYLARAEAPSRGQAQPDPEWIAKLGLTARPPMTGSKSLRVEALPQPDAGPPRLGRERRLAQARRPDERTRLARPIEDVAADILDKRRRRVRRRGRELDAIDPEARHEVRIEAKKLRYATEFFTGLVEGKAARRRLKTFLSALEELQEVLGNLNDLETAKALAAEAGPDAPPASAPAQADEGELLARAVAAHRVFADAKPFWGDFA
jgi:CHAD domain-containing protein